MADMIYGNSYASTQKEWHGKGTLMLPGESLESWIARSGMGYKIGRAKVRYPVARLAERSLATELRTMDDKIVLFRMDNGNPLGVVSDSYKVVQPAEVWETFREWAASGGMTLESGGVLFGGKRYFATARLADDVQALDGPNGKDRIKAYALMSTSADGTLKSELAWKSTRVVCWNTMQMAFGEGKAEYSVSHRSVWRPEEAKKVLETANAAFGAYMESARLLAGIRVSSKQAEDLYLQLLVTPTRDSDKVRESSAFKRMLALFNGEGKGSTLETARETAWGWLQGVTEYADHYARAHSDENRFAAAMWGPADSLKNKAASLILTA